MSFNGSGLFQINSAGQPVVTGTTISSTAFNALTADLGTGLSTAICKDGQTATTARIPFASGISVALSTDTTSGSTGGIYTAGGIGATKALFTGTSILYLGGTTSSQVSLRRLNQTLIVALGDNSTYANMQCASISASGVTNDTGLAASEYTPTITNTSNVTGSTSGPAQWLRVGNTVFVSFYITIQATSTTLTTVRLSLPVTSAFNNLANASGAASSSASSGGGIFAVSSASVVEYNFVATATGSQTGHFGTFAYKVI